MDADASVKSEFDIAAEEIEEAAMVMNGDGIKQFIHGMNGADEEEEEGGDEADEKVFIGTKLTRRGGGNKQRSVERQKWLQNRVPYTYTELIAMAIKAQPDNRATLAEIYDFLRDNFECFRGHYTGWKNCIRHTLTLAKSFQKVARTGRTGRAGIGNYWSLSDYYHQRHLPGGNGRRGTRRSHVQNPEMLSGRVEHKQEQMSPSDENPTECDKIGKVIENVVDQITPNRWEQQQSKDVEELLRRIGIVPKVEMAKKEDAHNQNGIAGGTQHQQHQHFVIIPRQPQQQTENGITHVAGQQPQQQQIRAVQQTTQNGLSRIRSGTKLDLLLAKMAQLRNAANVPPQAPIFPPSFRRSPPSSAGELQPHQQFLAFHHQLNTVPSTSSAPPTIQSPPLLHNNTVVPQLGVDAEGVDNEDEVITVDDEEEMVEDTKQEPIPVLTRMEPTKPPGPSMASISQISAWLGLVAGEMRLRLQCDGKNGVMVISPRNQGRSIHRIQFIPVNDNELAIRQFIGDQLYQEKRWTWTERQEEQTLYAIRGMCFHFFFCR